MSADLQKEVIEICREHDIVLLCDEVYRLLEHVPSETRYVSVLRQFLFRSIRAEISILSRERIPSVANVYNKGISCVTMSKPWGGCGISIGWLACSDMGIIQKLVDVQYFGTACVSRASEIQARMVLAASNSILEDRRDIILKNKKLLEDFIEKRHNEWFAWKKPNAGAIAFVEFKGPWTSEELGMHLKEAGISIKPTYCFTDRVTPALEKYFRVGFGETKFHLALDALDVFVKSHELSWRKSIQHC